VPVRKPGPAWGSASIRVTVTCTRPRSTAPGGRRVGTGTLLENIEYPAPAARAGPAGTEDSEPPSQRTVRVGEDHGARLVVVARSPGQ
jgi:hypothetical protein